MRIYIARASNNVNVVAGDSITVLGNVVSVSGALGSNATVLVQPQFGAPFSCLGSDANAPATNGPATSYDHQQYGNSGDQVSIPATVLSILSGVGSVALLSVLLRSGLVVTVTSGSVLSANQGGAGPTTSAS